MAEIELKKLDFEIFKYSSYSSSYLPENIREDIPTNQTSRWSSNTNTPPQFLILKLERPAIVKKIKFGKYEKTHVCNLRKFKILGGMDEDRLMLLFEGGLKNDSIPETFNLKHRTNTGELLPIKFIKIVPLLSWGPSFNFCIWYVELLGVEDTVFILSNLRKYNMLREVEIIRLFMKHCRQQGYTKTFDALKEETNVKLENSKMTELHNILVNEGDFKKTEELLVDFIDNGMMDCYLSRQDYKAKWSLQTVDEDLKPGKRGGHQLIIDPVTSTIYLYGGWDGSEDLSDLWSYNVTTCKWTLIHERSELLDGPSPRACHKMVYDTKNSQIFIIGRYLDNSSRIKENINSDFYVYDTINKTWCLICNDTSQVGGPHLLYDHQMCIDVDKQTLYVFGGRIVSEYREDEADCQYSGLFSYHISTNTWTQILVDCNHPTASSPHVNSIKSRVTHAMLFHPRHRKLYIFGGQRGKEYMSDILVYDVDNNELSNLTYDNNNGDSKNVPQPGFTQRATIDHDKDEIYVLTSLSKDKERRDLTINSFWVFSLTTKEWVCVYKCDHSIGENCYLKNQTRCPEPCPRYAHQIVYDNANHVHYLFGGNPGMNSKFRLDDFWALRLEKPTREHILRYCKYLLRKQEYEEIAKQNPLGAIQYLQTKLSDIIDHSDPKQLKEFHKLASLIFRTGFTDAETDPTSLLTISIDAFNSSSEESSSKESAKYLCDSGKILSDDASSTTSSMSSECSTTKLIRQHSKEETLLFEIKIRRCLLYNKLVDLLPEALCQPKKNISDFVLL